MQSPVTKAKWVSDKELVVGTTEGKLFRFFIKLDDQKVPYLENPNAIYTSEGLAAIWDIAISK